MLTANNAERAGDLLRVHGERNRLFGEHLFTPDAWDILLHFHTAGGSQPVEAIREALDLFEDTADRWIAVLENENLVERDGPGAFRLTDRARRDMEKALTAQEG
jgi:DNA-binding MarR family transcriptional regulator